MTWPDRPSARRTRSRTRPTETATSSSCRRSSASSGAHRMPSTTDLTRLAAHEMATHLRQGEVSSREIAEAHLAVAERQNRALNAWLSIDRERALEEADAAHAPFPAARAEGPAALDALPPI